MIKRITVNQLAVLAALFLSCVSAYFSITGMAMLFSGATVAVMIMATALEFSKVISAAWLQRNWKTSSVFIRAYLVLATVILILLTSMGTFGYLSRAHLATADSLQLSQLQIQPLQDQISFEQRKLKNAQTSLDTLDRFANNSDPKDAVYIRSRQKGERQRIDNQINDTTERLEALNAKLLPLKTKEAMATSDIGPLKYIAEMIYGKNASDHFDETVRFVIIFIVMVFDPLAIILLLAGNSTNKEVALPPTRKTRRPRTRKASRDMVSIPKSSITNFIMDD
jgi:hypothetical protein